MARSESRINRKSPLLSDNDEGVGSKKDAGRSFVQVTVSRVLAFFLVVGYVAIAPAAAQQPPTTVNPPPSSPVTINQCEAWTNDLMYDMNIGEEIYVSGVGIKFTNNSSNTVTGLVVEVSIYDKSNAILPTFSRYFSTARNRAAAGMALPPGASFSLLGKIRNWQFYANVFHDNEHVECTIAVVTFADGTVWRPADPI
jgi:hypothetical protein